MCGFTFRAPLWAAALFLAAFAHRPAGVRAATGAWQQRTFAGVLSVQSIVQTPDRHIWFAGTDGVQRFDGVDWKPLTSLPPGPARRLLLTPDGVWVATGGGFLERYPDPQSPVRVGFRTEHAELYLVSEQGVSRADFEGLPSPWVWALANRPGTRDVWAGTEDGVVQIAVSAEGRMQKPRLVVRGTQLPSPFVTTLLFNDARSVWIGTSRGLVLGTVDAAGAVTVDGPRLNGIFHLAHTQTPHVLASTSDGVFDVAVNGATKRSAVGDAPTPFVASSQGVVIGVHNGTPGSLWPDQTTTFTPVEVRDPLAIMRDHEGSYWFGQRSGPLTQVLQPPVRNMGPPEGLLGDVAFSIHRAHDDSLWITTTKGIVHNINNNLTSFRYGTDVPIWSARSIAQAADHTLFFAADTAVLQQRGGAFIKVGAGLTGDFVRSLYVDTSNTLWLGWEHAGLSAYPHANISAATRRDLVSSSGVCDGAQVFAGEAPAGTLWWTAADRGVTRVQIDNGEMHVRCFKADLGLQHNELTAVVSSPSGHVWAATLGRVSLARWSRDHFEPLPAACGVAAGGFFSLTTTADRVWATSNRGVFRAAWSDLESCMDGRRNEVPWFRIDERSGMRSPICIAAFPPTVATDASGALWVATTAGISIIEANQTQAPPHAVLEALVVNGRSLPSAAEAQVEPGPQSLQWSWTAPSFVLPQAVRFRYQLNGLDAGWVDAGQERSARYGVIPPGDYTFRVQAYLAGGGPESPTIGESHIRVRPTLLQSWWFRLALLLFTACALWWWHRARLRQLAARHRAVHDERSRLAREIHDGLGQAFLGVRFHLDGLDHLLSKRGRDEQEADLLNESRNILTRAETELRETIWDLRAASATRSDLASSLQAQCARLENNLGRKVHFHWEGPMVPSSGLREHELPRVVEEAVTNAVRHADALQIDVLAECTAEGLRLTVRNGPGRAKPQGTDRPGFGLVGMQERATSTLR